MSRWKTQLFCCSMNAKLTCNNFFSEFKEAIACDRIYESSFRNKSEGLKQAL